MAVTLHRYNHTTKLFFNKQVDLTNLKAMLLDATAVAAFDATMTTVDAVAGVGPTRAHEVYGFGWTQGGELFSGVAITVRSTNGAALTVADIDKVATGGNIGPASGVLVYDATGAFPLWLYDFGGAQTAGQETDFKIVFDPTGTRGTVLVIS